MSQNVFQGTPVSRVVVGNGVKNIPDNAFQSLTSLSQVVFSSTVKRIGLYAFYGCSSIDTIWTRGATKTIGDHAFDGCTQAYVLILSDQIDSIGTYAFYQCSALPSIEIPNSVKFIGASAFKSCSTLTSIYSKMRRIPSMSGDIFQNSTRSSATLTMPCNMTSRYRANSYWNFTTIQEDNNCQTSFLVSAIPNHSEWGSITGSGIYKYLRTLNFSAQPHEGYIFAGWNDGVTNPNRTVTVTRDTVIQALFTDPNNLIIHDTTFITVPVHDTTFVDVPVHDTTYVSVHDTTFVPVHDTTYVDVPYPVHDTTYVTQFDTVSVTLYDTTYITVHDTVTLKPNMYTMTVYSNNLQCGLAAGNGEFPEGSVVEIAAIPIEGYHFEQWQDGNTQNPRSVTLTEDITFIASFGTVGVASPELRTYEVYAVRNEIVVRKAAGSRVRIFDAKGSLLSCEQSVLEEYRFPVLATGTYLVQVDNDSACKVVVVRQ